MKKILHINTSTSKGGAAKIARTIHKKINSKMKFKSYFVFGRGNDSNCENSMKFTLQPEIYLHGLITRFLGIEGYGNYFSTLRLINFIEKRDFDIIHLHNLHGYYLNIFQFINYLKRKKLSAIWTFHDGWPITGSCAYIKECKKWENGCRQCMNKKWYPQNYINNSEIMWKKKRKVFSNGWDPIIVTPSKWLAQNVKKSFLKNHRVKIINNGINTEIFKKYDKNDIFEEYNIPKNKKTILFIASDLNNEKKGAKYFFDSLKYIDKKYNILIVGNKLKKYNVKSNIYQLGYIYDQEKLAKLYSASNIYCITSLDENFPTTVLESLSCGTPVVGFDVGGISEQVNDACGFVVPSKNEKELAKKIEILIKNDNLRNKMSDNCRKKALKKYSIKRMLKSYIKLYDSIKQRG